jgi:hypothetical protein
LRVHFWSYSCKLPASIRHSRAQLCARVAVSRSRARLWLTARFVLCFFPKATFFSFVALGRAPC